MINLQNVTYDDHTARISAFEPRLARQIWQDKKINLLEIDWKRKVAPFEPCHLASLTERIYTLNMKVDVDASPETLKEQLRTALGGNRINAGLAP